MRSTMLQLLTHVLTLASIAAQAVPSDAEELQPRRHIDIVVHPGLPDAANAATSAASPLRSVHAAAHRVRSLRMEHPRADITVHLLPGVHHVGDFPLTLSKEHAGRHDGWVTWRSADPSRPAVLGGPTRVTGWLEHPTKTGAFIAPLPPNITKGTPLRQLWVNGERAERPLIHGHGRQGGDNKEGYCHNLTLVEPTHEYPLGSAYSFEGENATDPTQWLNPEDVEFVWTGCDAINCWVEPRCTVESVSMSGIVRLKQDGNASCFHRLYNWPSCFVNGDTSAGPWTRGRFPVSIENVASNWSFPGQWYYDRKNATIGYIPRAGETIAQLEASATTSTVEELLVVNDTQNIRWEDVHFAFATWSGSSGNSGYVDTQSGYLCQQGEPPVNVRVWSSTNVTFSGCSFRHLGAVYALGAHNASQDIIISNCTFTDCSGGAIKLGNVGERGAPGPAVDLPVSLQDRGYLVSDNLIYDLPREYSSANPIFAGYVADTSLVHNSIRNSTYSAICAGWGWGESSYMRGMKIEYNMISHPMQPTARGQLEDGGCVYTNSPCPNCSVSHNSFDNDPTVYGCIYHDGGSGLWNDHFNVFNHIKTSGVFAHGSSAHTTVVDMWLNDTQGLALEGDTNRDVRDPVTGACIDDPMNITRQGTKDGPHGDDRYRVFFGPWTDWPPAAQAVIDAAGRRSSFPPPRAPPLSPQKRANEKPPIDCAPPPGGRTGRFAATPCKGLPSQLWLLDKNVTPGDGTPTSIQRDHAKGGCIEIESCSGDTVNCNWGCMATETNSSVCANNPCACHGTWQFKPEGTIKALAGTCLETSNGAGSTVTNAPCTGKANQKWLPKYAGTGFDGRNAWAITQETGAGVALCIDVDAK